MEKIVNSMINHPHCYQWTLVLIALVLFIAFPAHVTAFLLGCSYGVAVFAHIKRTIARSFHVA